LPREACQDGVHLVWTTIELKKVGGILRAAPGIEGDPEVGSAGDADDLFLVSIRVVLVGTLHLHRREDPRGDEPLAVQIVHLLNCGGDGEAIEFIDLGGEFSKRNKQFLRQGEKSGIADKHIERDDQVPKQIVEGRLCQRIIHLRQEILVVLSTTFIFNKIYLKLSI